MIKLFHPYLPKHKILEEISNTLDSNWIGQGPKVDLFEKKFANKMGYSYPVMVNSATSALEMTYHLLDLNKGDKVIVPVLNAISGQVGLIRRGCEILFSDIEKETLNIDPISLEKILSTNNHPTNKIKAVIGVHLGGIHFNKEVYSVCKKYNVPLIVDSAQYLAPTKGDYICYSFQAIKHITTADGGMLILNNKKEYERAKKLRWFGIPRGSSQKKSWKLRPATFDFEEAGYKFQPTDIDACFALAGLPDLDKIIKYRKNLVALYRKQLRSQENVQIVAADTFWLLTIFAENRDQLADYLLKNNIECNLAHIRNDIYTVLGGKRQNLENMDWVESRYICLPLNTYVKKSDVQYICKIIRQFYSKRSSAYSKRSSAYSKKGSAYAKTQR